MFFDDGDYELYLDLRSDAAARSGVAIWSYCLMPNHVHIIAVPGDEDGLRRTFRQEFRGHYTKLSDFDASTFSYAATCKTPKFTSPLSAGAKPRL